MKNPHLLQITSNIITSKIKMSIIILIKHRNLSLNLRLVNLDFSMYFIMS